jgi:hypothetical protein
MTAVKTLAIGALVIGAVAQAASAGHYSGDSFNWIGWNAGTGEILGNNTTVHPFPLIAVAPSIAPASTSAPATNNPATSIIAAVAAATPAPAPAATIAPMVATATTYSAPAPISAPAPAASASPVTTYDAFLNLGSAPFPDASNLTANTPSAWASSNSSDLLKLFGGHPTTQQQSDFNNAIVQRVEQTFSLSNIPLNLTTDPNAHASHTMSVVSNTDSSWGPLLGLTNIGGNGFSFIDNAAKSAQSVDQLEWIVAHNVSHELMLAFGVGENYDKSGHYIDAEMAQLGMMLDPKATFSSGAAAALLDARAAGGNAATGGAFAQEVGPQTVPEPTTIAVWAIAAAGVVFARRNRARRAIA